VTRAANRVTCRQAEPSEGAAPAGTRGPVRHHGPALSRSRPPPGVHRPARRVGDARTPALRQRRPAADGPDVTTIAARTFTGALLAAASALTPAQAAVSPALATAVTVAASVPAAVRHERPRLVPRLPAPPVALRHDPAPHTGPRGRALWTVPGSQAAQAAERLKGSRPADAALLARMGATPTALWLGNWTPRTSVGATIRRAVAPALAHGAVVTLVLYAVPQRDCARAGLPNGTEYRAWVDTVARALAGAPAVVVVEPDALSLTDCLAPAAAAERSALLRYAVERLSHGSTWVYLDVGHSRWRPAADVAVRLRAAGVERARGFALNVANFGTTADQVAYGHQVSDSLGAATPFVVDVGRNGRGPGEGELAWCNPPGRAVGAAPTTSAADELVDALLWVKPPGESDGTCRAGAPAAGEFWVDYALGLARTAGWPAPAAR
jgi:endoglucanase